MRSRQSLSKMFAAAYAGAEAPVSIVEKPEERDKPAGWLGLRSARAAVAVHEVMYRHIDHLGSARVITDQNGELFQRLDYKPFGKLHYQEINPAVSIPAFARDKHWFTGQEFDGSTGLYYFGARTYDPEIGRFLQVDPVVQDPSFSQSFNGYAYVSNNPLGGTDPSGMFMDPALEITGSILSMLITLPWAELTVQGAPVEMQGPTAGVVMPGMLDSGGGPANAVTGPAGEAVAVGGGAGDPFNPLWWSKDVPEKVGVVIHVSDPPGPLAPASPAPEAPAAEISLPVAADIAAAVESALSDARAGEMQNFDQVFGGLASLGAVGRAAYVWGGTAYSSFYDLGMYPVNTSVDMLFAGKGTSDYYSTGDYDALGADIGRGTGLFTLMGGAAAGTVGRAGGTASQGITKIFSGLRAGNSPRVKVVGSEAELESLFTRMSAGGKPVPGTRYPGGRMVRLPDGTTVGIRSSSTSGGPAMDIKTPERTIMKVHIKP